MRHFSLARTMVALTVVAAVFAVWSGVSWYTAAHSEDRRYSALRDEVLSAGAQAVQNLNTLDYRDLDKGLRLWQDSTTAALFKQLADSGPAFRDSVLKAKSVSTAEISECGITELDARVGKARLILSVRLTVTPAEGDPVTKRLREVAEMTRTSQGWKLSALGNAPETGGGQ
ncbi:hypothetical protein [Actinocorallia longicatena]|uniref:Nuclear transport factor 2 family protein n=1 Tax=Actinocorallia longicatena TaxID=111803 RepID=A0ABP6QN61_9ACTN